MAVLTAKKSKPATDGHALLYNGDVMKQPEFHHRYSMCSEDEKYELIGGVVYMASPVRRPRAATVRSKRRKGRRRRRFP